ncbi:MAG: RpiB/LacA/LacB family sugar-phosphate isomerase [Spirochaetia bacterium]
MIKRVVIGVDHGGLAIKERLITRLESHEYEVKDMGVFSSDSVDYPDKVEEVYREYTSGNYEFAVVCCGTGIGVTISANKLPGVRCALPQNSFAAGLAKKHNNANFIAFGGRIEYSEPPEDMLDAFINEEFEGDRHQRRVNKIMKLE